MAGTFHKCPACRRPVGLVDRTCTSCGEQLQITCPYCGYETLIQSNCRYCRSSLYVVCPNKDCGRTQLISGSRKCRNCGTPFKLPDW